jgi:methylphosphotriester-DNA--protein-cysteine methyltransferase
VQLTTGITDATAKAKAFTQQIDAAASSAERLAQMERELQRAEDDNIDTNKRLLNEVERLKNVRDNEFNTIKQRQAANEKAYKVEMQREATLTDLASRRVELLRAQIEQEGGRDRVSRERFQELKNAENELADIREDAAGKQNELITNRYQLEQEKIDKSIERRAQAIALDTALLNKQLAQVRVNSDKELSLRQQLLNKGREAELNVKNLTVQQKRTIDAKYESDSLALTLDFNRRRLQAALQAATDLTTAELAGQRAGSDEALRLQAEQIEQQRVQALAGLQANADNTAATAKINAQAAQQQRQLEYANATQQLTDYLDQKRQAVELDYAKGIIQEGEYQRQLAAITTAGIQAQAVVNEDYQQDNSENRKQATEDEIAQARRTTDATKLTEKTKQDIKEATLQAAINHTDTLISLFGEETAAGQAAMAIKKVLGLAEIALNLQKELAANKLAGAQLAAFIPPPLGITLGTAYTIAADAVSITAAAAGAAAILKLQRGGIADGPSHAQGGIPLYRNGRPAGIEIEGGEPVLTNRVTQSPVLLSMASAINQLAGGRALVPNVPFPRLALGGITVPLVQQQLRGNMESGMDYPRLAKEIAKVKIYTRTSDTKAALGRDAFTESQANS